MNQPTFHMENRREKFCIIIVVILVIFIFYILYLEHADAVMGRKLEDEGPGLNYGAGNHHLKKIEISYSEHQRIQGRLPYFDELFNFQ
ncbi:Oidioi.mRNA.OKI2018_I69.PAR.g12766.t1.cds [Oikopleura dioica]|uniref:Oidioi.mRNA.OKI2018_I69.PAR.g12766.t1.cds n=1 Tax=Oikopleura dioica TaxID=34765 RepID=A0ABN7S265_OIKDI|nr:Oidioi.mRNA.OKI2018_I69.PAR.g12766.t1.cds [Oikopleura dioica]